MLAINAEPRHQYFEPRKRLAARRVGWCEEEKTTKLWKQLEGDEQKACSLESQPKMAGIVNLVADWISLTEMKALQSACVLVSLKARENEYEEFLSHQDDQVWRPRFHGFDDEAQDGLSLGVHGTLPLDPALLKCF